MPLPPLPQLFDRIPGGLFAPLGGATATLHWSILGKLYQHEFEREPFFLVKQVAVEVAEQAVSESPLWNERRDELLAAEEPDRGTDAAETIVDEAALLRATARRLLLREERAGWFHYEYRSEVGLVLNFFPYAARILETLVRVARDEQPEFQGYAHSIATLLRPDTFAARPGVSLREARRHTLEMVRELKILNRNIYALTQRLLDTVSTAAGVLEQGIDHYRDAVQANYHRLKTVDNLYKWRTEILGRLEGIEADDVSLESAARFYSEQLRSDRDTARQQVCDDLALMRSQFETLPEITDDIDARNARFSGVALRKLMYLLRQDRRTEGQLQLLVDRLARDEAPELTFDVYRCELLPQGLAFLYTPPAERPRVEAQPLARKPPADNDAIRREAAARVRRPFARARIEEAVEQLLAGRSRAPLREAPLDSDEDYVRLIHIAAFGLDGGSRYRFRRSPGERDKKGPYGFPAGDVEKSRRPR